MCNSLTQGHKKHYNCDQEIGKYNNIYYVMVKPRNSTIIRIALILV